MQLRVAFMRLYNEYKTALRLKPDFIETHYDFGLAYIDQGRIDDAIKKFRHHLENQS